MDYPVLAVILDRLAMSRLVTRSYLKSRSRRKMSRLVHVLSRHHLEDCLVAAVILDLHGKIPTRQTAIHSTNLDRDLSRRLGLNRHGLNQTIDLANGLEAVKQVALVQTNDLANGPEAG